MPPVADQTAATPRCELAHFFREYGQHYRHNHSLPLSHLWVMGAVEHCRTSFLGGHHQQCGTCGFEYPAYNSCCNRSASGGPVNGQSPLGRKTKLRARPRRLFPPRRSINDRILSVHDAEVTFTYCDRKHGDRLLPNKLPVEEFIRRSLLHVLPSGFM